MVAEPAYAVRRQGSIIPFEGRRAMGGTVQEEGPRKKKRAYAPASFMMVDTDAVEWLHGDWKAACFLAKLLDLQELSKDGWVYHSWPQWSADYFSRDEVLRCLDLKELKGVIEVEIRRHDGRDTRHYRVNIKNMKTALSTLRKTRRVNEVKAAPEANDNHHEEKSHGAENPQGPCDIPADHPAENLQGLLGSDLTNRSSQTDRGSDATASGGAAIADAPAPNAPPQGDKTKTTRSVRRPNTDRVKASDPPELIAFRNQCCGLIRARFNGGDPTNSELGAIRNLYNKGIPFAQVRDCWEKFTADTSSRFTPSFDLMPMKMRDYLADPERFRANHAPHTQANGHHTSNGKGNHTNGSRRPEARSPISHRPGGGDSSPALFRGKSVYDLTDEEYREWQDQQGASGGGVHDQLQKAP